MFDEEKEKINFSLPDSLVSEVDHFVKMQNSNREDFIKSAFQFYINHKKNIDVEETMIQGYKEMAQINLSLAELGMTYDVSSDNDEKEKIAPREY